MSRKAQAVGRLAVTVGTLVIIVFLWVQNANKLATFSDYSVLAYGNAFLERGLLPFRDFTTPLQSLTFFLAEGCERLFGRRYWSLAWGNLILTLCLFVAALVYARKVLPYAAALFVALAVCVASSLQHGVIWYNSVGLLWILLASYVWFAAIQRHTVRLTDIFAAAVILLASGLTKLNYHAVTLGITLFGITCLYLRRNISFPKFLALSVGLFCWAVCAPVLVELAITQVGFSQWALDVLIRPARRGRQLGIIRHREFWLGTVFDYYLGSAFKAFFALELALVMAALVKVHPGAGIRLMPRLTPADGAQHQYGVPLLGYVLPSVTVFMFFGLSVIVAATNVDLPSIGQTILIFGLISVLVGFGDGLSDTSRRWVQATALIFSALLILAGTITLFRHTRLTFGDTPLNTTYPYRVSSGSYLEGIYVTSQSHQKLVDAGALLKEFNIPAGSDTVYWGPGIELFCREFQTVPQRGFPLFYHPLTIREEEVPALVARLEASRVRLFIADPTWMFFLPKTMDSYLTTHWRRGTMESLVYFVRP
jgi:hypothetical protein